MTPEQIAAIEAWIEAIIDERVVNPSGLPEQAYRKAARDAVLEAFGYVRIETKP